MRDIRAALVNESLHCRALFFRECSELLSAYREDTGPEFQTDSRDLFLQEAKREGLMPVFETESGTYIYSDFVQESFAVRTMRAIVCRTALSNAVRLRLS